MYDTKQTIEQVTDFAKKATALGFYKQYRVSAELGSQIAGMMEKEFIDYLEENGVSVWKTIFYKGIMPSEKVLDFPVDCNTLTGSVNL